MACILLWSSAVRVHDSQANRKMDVMKMDEDMIIAHVIDPLFICSQEKAYL